MAKYELIIEFEDEQGFIEFLNHWVKDGNY